jgi:putative flavoprotein involved in K+ transport
MRKTDPGHYDTIVIGGGQTGMAVGYELEHRGIDFVILDASARVGDAWRRRWDSLRLFTPARYSGLPGLPYPGNGGDEVTKDDIASYLETYADANGFPIKTNTRVTKLRRDAHVFTAETSSGEYQSDNVVVAMADYQKPRVPEFAPDLDPEIVQMHSSSYKNLTQLRPGPTLVVGMGNSGADIGLEVAAEHPTYVSGSPGGVIPFRIENLFGRTIGVRLVRFAAIRVLNTKTPIGRKARPKMLHEAAPLVRVKPRDLWALGAKQVGRVSGVSDGRPQLDDGTVLDVNNVIWCTGFKAGFDWIEIPVFDDSGDPVHDRGITREPGLYFCGLGWLHALWSETLTGVPIDASHIARHLSDRDRQSQPVH